MKKWVFRNLASVAMPAILLLNPALTFGNIQPHKSISTSGSNLDLLLDPIFEQQMTKLHIPGAVIAIVKDGKVVFTKGYGYADVEKKTFVVPNTTIFRIGSIT